MMFKCKKIIPDYESQCDNCGASPIVPTTGLCGPCTFGEAATLDGNWDAIVDERCEDCKCNRIIVTIEKV